ncbi:oxidoreductase [Granulicella mallensis]|uniref:NAD(P)-dependent dehydrogenase (Short-subunit alcohol dehydrogenase family) n=1 Tax=Granulicella mallensis TaxID=940614 RepID=A0A7W7ZPA0_9BACT|nr:oxidoreductase [Granulicella mallensis]MBB5063222.1 NAD(P)-dependent dehydrogenase (short-subunit alcohol dehydrogenase family) [Granulicella mallensis]
MSNSTGNTQAGKVWFITGASTGFGREMAEQLLAGGAKVVATARKPEQLSALAAKYPETALVLPLDVTREDTVQSAVEKTLAKFGHVDVLVNNAGYGVLGAVEEVTEAEFMPMYETNVFGLIRVTKAFLPQFRERRSGHIVNLSSIGGLVGLSGWGFYNSTKFAVEGFSEALSVELAPLGVKVLIVEPGPFRTDFLGRSGQEVPTRIADYDETAGKTREYMKTNDGKQVGDPVRAVQAIIAAVASPNTPKHLLLGKLALTRFRAKLDEFTQELAAWEPVTLGADFPEGE